MPTISSIPILSNKNKVMLAIAVIATVLGFTGIRYNKKRAEDVALKMLSVSSLHGEGMLDRRLAISLASYLGSPDIVKIRSRLQRGQYSMSAEERERVLALLEVETGKVQKKENLEKGLIALLAKITGKEEDQIWVDFISEIGFSEAAWKQALKSASGSQREELLALLTELKLILVQIGRDGSGLVQAMQTLVDNSNLEYDPLLNKLVMSMREQLKRINTERAQIEMAQSQNNP